MRTATYHSIIGIILLTGLLIRIIPVWTNPENAFGGLGLFGDTIAYTSTAENIVKGKGFSQAPDGSVPSILRPPLYPVFLALCFWFKGWSLDFCRTVQGFIDCATVFLLYLSARLLTKGKKEERICGALAALIGSTCPYFIFYSRQLLSETLVIFLMALALYVHLKAQQERKFFLWFLAGSTVAIAGLTRPDAGWIIVPLLCIHYFLLRRKGAKAFISLTAVVLGFVLCLTPWTWRNVSQFGKPIPFSSGNLGLNLYMGTWEESSRWMEEGWEFPPDSGPAGEREEVEKTVSLLKRSHLVSGGSEMFDLDRKLLLVAINRILSNPWEYVKLLPSRLLRLLWIDPYDKYHAGEPGAAAFVIYLVLAVMGSLFLYKNSGGLVLIPWTVIAYVTIVHIPMHVEARFSLQGMPALIVLASGVGRVSGLHPHR